MDDLDEDGSEEIFIDPESEPRVIYWPGYVTVYHGPPEDSPDEPKQGH